MNINQTTQLNNVNNITDNEEKNKNAAPKEETPEDFSYLNKDEFDTYTFSTKNSADKENINENLKEEEYDNSGNLIATIVYDDESKESYTKYSNFDSDNNVCFEERYEADKSYSSKNYSYTKNIDGTFDRDIVSEYESNKDGKTTLRSSYKYNPDGSFASGYSVATEYDETTGKAKAETITLAGGSPYNVPSSGESGLVRTVVNKDSNTTIEYRYDENGTLFSAFKILRGINGNKIYKKITIE